MLYFSLFLGLGLLGNVLDSVDSTLITETNILFEYVVVVFFYFTSVSDNHTLLLFPV